MNSDSQHDALPPALEAALRGLGGVRAPAELAARVALAQGGAERAPAELWGRVAADLAPEFGRAPAGRGRLLRLTPRRLAAAAGLLVLAGLAWQMQPGSDAPDGPLYASDGPAPRLAEPLPEARRAELLARFVVVDVPPSRLSPAARAMAEMLSGPASGAASAPMKEEG